MTTRRHAAARTGGRHLVMPAVAALLMLGGCASQYTAVPPSAFPPPLMEALQMAVNLEMDEAFRTYTHTETMTDLRAATWTMPIGPASVDWMTSLVGSRFTSIDGGKNAALQISPKIERVEFLGKQRLVQRPLRQRNVVERLAATTQALAPSRRRRA